MERIPEFAANHLFLVSLFFGILILLIWNLFSGVLTGVTEVSPQEATRLINREHAVVVDVRLAEAFSAGHIIGALNIPAAELEARRKELEKYRERPLIAGCQTGADSARVARSLKQAGFDRACVIKGGIAAWKGANLPLTRSDSKHE